MKRTRRLLDLLGVVSAQSSRMPAKACRNLDELRTAIVKELGSLEREQVRWRNRAGAFLFSMLLVGFSLFACQPLLRAGVLVTVGLSAREVWLYYSHRANALFMCWRAYILGASLAILIFLFGHFSAWAQIN